ncbi:MAG: ISKra4 family transposase [Acidimicrobiales bacterium]
MPRNIDDDAFARSRARFEEVVGFLDGEGAATLSHGELEDRLGAEGRELLRLLYQDHLDLRAEREPRLEAVVDADGTNRPSVEAGHARTLTTIFGQVDVNRLAYRRRSRPNLPPADGVLNLPAERHSHGLRRLAATEAARGSFDDATAAIRSAAGAPVGKRQVEGLARSAAVDFEAFYAARARPAPGPDDVVVLSVDAKGIVMRPGALRPATASAAQKATTKLQTRLSKGEKRNRKRMAEVGTVYTVAPVPRTPADVLAPGEGAQERQVAPRAAAKWLTASVVEDAASVVADVFDEAERRDPAHERTWVALADGNNHQIDRIGAEAGRRQVEVRIVVDFIHVLEYLWRAAWSFFAESDAAAEAWVQEKALAVLDGKASIVAAAIRRKATRWGLEEGERVNADRAADYLLHKAAHLDYPTALAKGWPIATGVIEGACRHLVKDRMDITGARWGLEGAEAVLKLRAVRANGDFDAYWRFHLDQERSRVHESRYSNDIIPAAA